MRREIEIRLQYIEQEHDCKILYACESGIRAWGFHSPDSDYDVRFIYAKPLDWHLKLDSKRDTIEKMLPGNLDFAGWELKKTLTLFSGCNLPLNEWLGSPDVYFADTKFTKELTVLLPKYFNPKRACFHYGSIAHNTAEKHMNDSRVNIKKAFYILRPLLAVQWITDRQTMPPTAFSNILAETDLPDAVRICINDLLKQKKSALESDVVTLPAPLNEWIQDRLESFEQTGRELPPAGKEDWGSLNEVFRRWVIKDKLYKQYFPLNV